MTEAEWLECDNPQELAEAVRNRISPRRARLLAVSLCRHISPMITSNSAQQAIDEAELYADGSTTREDMLAASEQVGNESAVSDFDYLIANGAHVEVPLHVKAASIAIQSTQFASLASDEFDYLDSCVRCTYLASLRRWLLQAQPDEARPQYTELVAWQRTLILDIFGNPFRPVAFDAAWRTDTALSLARHMYESRDFSAMPILADALQDAGCDHDDILNHCRDVNGVHVRGCWVVDLVLGKV